MKHDEYCELKRSGERSCGCAGRAYARDPYPGAPKHEDDTNFDEWMSH